MICETRPPVLVFSRLPGLLTLKLTITLAGNAESYTAPLFLRSDDH